MVIHNLTHRDNSNVYIYCDTTDFIIYTSIDKKFYEYYNPEKGLVKAWKSGALWVEGSTYRSQVIHHKEDYITRIKLELSDYSKVYIFKSNDKVDFVNVATKLSNEKICNSTRDNNILTVKTSISGTILISTSIFPQDNPLIKLDGSYGTYIIPEELSKVKLFVHYMVDECHLSTTIMAPIPNQIINSPDKPNLLLDQYSVRISWVNPNPFDTFNIIKRKVDGPWVEIATMVNNPPVYDRGINSYPIGSYFYRVVGIKDNKSYISPESFIYAPGEVFLSMKPTGRAVSSAQLTTKWQAPVILGC